MQYDPSIYTTAKAIECPENILDTSQQKKYMSLQ